MNTGRDAVDELAREVRAVAGEVDPSGNFWMGERRVERVLGFYALVGSREGDAVLEGRKKRSPPGSWYSMAKPTKSARRLARFPVSWRGGSYRLPR